MMIKRKLSADPSSLILGIIGLVIIIPGCCCGIFGIVALVLCVIGLIMAEKSLKEYNRNKEQFDRQSRGNVQTGKILCIVGIVISAIILIIYLFYFLFFGAMFSDVIRETYNNRNGYPYSVQDSIENYQDFDYHDSVPNDTIVVDSPAIQSNR